MSVKSSLKKTQLLWIMGGVSAQNSVTLTFACQTSEGALLSPDSITIENLTQNWRETIYYPDTVYTLNVGASVPNRINDNGLQVMPNSMGQVF